MQMGFSKSKPPSAHWHIRTLAHQKVDNCNPAGGPLTSRRGLVGEMRFFPNLNPNPKTEIPLHKPPVSLQPHQSRSGK
jgi:hypothetical protein